MADLVTITGGGAFTRQNITGINDNFDALNTGGGGGSFLHQATVTLTNAQIKALPLTGVDIIPAQGSGTVVICGAYVGGGLSGAMFMHWVADYTNVDASIAWQFYVGNFNNILASYDAGDFFVWGAASPFFLLGPQSDPDTSYPIPVINSISDFDNKAVTLKVLNASLGALTGGNASNTLTVSLPYMILNLSTGVFE